MPCLTMCGEGKRKPGRAGYQRRQAGSTTLHTLSWMASRWWLLLMLR